MRGVRAEEVVAKVIAGLAGWLFERSILWVSDLVDRLDRALCMEDKAPQRHTDEFPSAQPADLDEPELPYKPPVVTERTADHLLVAAAGGHDTSLGDHCVCSCPEVMHNHVLKETRFCIGCDYGCIQYQECDCVEQPVGEYPAVSSRMLADHPVYQQLQDDFNAG